jgi:hypothetical protein
LRIGKLEAHADGQALSIDPFERQNLTLYLVNPESPMLISKPLCGFDRLFGSIKPKKDFGRPRFLPNLVDCKSRVCATNAGDVPCVEQVL